MFKEVDLKDAYKMISGTAVVASKGKFSSNRIRLNKFGIFKLSFSSVGHEKAEDVSSSDIKNLRVLFTPSAELKKELSDVSYTRK